MSSPQPYVDVRRAPIVAGAHRNLEALGLRSFVHEPVVHHELDPRRGEQVQDARGLELFACHELATDVPRVRDQQPGGVGEGFC